jgi:hypothetical protein
MSLLRSFFIGLLVCITVVTSGPMATARVTSQGEVIVICTGDGLRQIMLGPDGAPMAPLPHCPDCTMQLLATLPPLASKPGVDLATRQRAPAKARLAVHSTRPNETHARGPPVLVLL